MDRAALRDGQWERIRGSVAGGTKGKRGSRTDNRKFPDALLWMARSGGRWRELPERPGDYRSVKRSRGGLSTRIAQSGAEVVIPPRRNRKVRRTYDVDLYKDRNRIERFFRKPKHFRRVATRCDKPLANLMAFVKPAAIAIWLR